MDDGAPPAAATTAAERTALIKSAALELGFEDVRVAAAGALAAQAHYERWLADGFHGEMHWLATRKHRDRRADPELILKGLQAVVCVILCHPPARDSARDQRLGRIARYATGEDYHLVMRDAMRRLEDFIRSLHEGSRALWYADTGAILERAWSERAGLGWVGKHSGLLSPTLGSWFLLGEVYVDYELVADAPLEREHCGTCERCITACPTGAIVAPYRVDARRCISYLTIEHAGVIPRALRAGIGEWIFGCDLCQEACPWNRFAPEARSARLHARELAGWSLERFLTLDAGTFATLFATSPIRRAERGGFLRNVCVALGNRADAASATALAHALAHDVEWVVRAHAAWALGEIAAKHGVATATGDGMTAGVALARAATDDAHGTVREEARDALARIGG